MRYKIMAVGTISTVEQAKKKIEQLERFAQREEDPIKIEAYEDQIDFLREVFRI